MDWKDTTPADDEISALDCFRFFSTSRALEEASTFTAETSSTSPLLGKSITSTPDGEGRDCCGGSFGAGRR